MKRDFTILEGAWGLVLLGIAVMAVIRGDHEVFAILIGFLFLASVLVTRLPRPEKEEETE